ncbi:MAG TPA: (E)-4-hydroxy-3-methylbut-2-enyl-diphosphate synthase [Ignavibacteriaceae bacterium]|nr:(E)-4-hydroxy-3-methylbut-2-enyl-diphosphate synthase [Ignavibacteriaceae bacterium]
MIENNLEYCNSLTKYSRLKTRVVNIGDVPLGGENPIRIQSMTTTDTMNTIATVEQTIRMIESGCDYVRITAPSKSEAQNLLEIKNELRRRGFKVPLIADIHFTPNAAEIAARIVEKVRINPGNYIDKKKFEFIEYNDNEYEEELERLREKFIPLVKICKEYGTAMRIGTNHGSLSDRIMSRFGDNPEGMVESALEFVRICEEFDYYNVVLSMKSSNPQVMVQAYRLLVNRMHKENMNYPLHLGVTEAGGGEDGRIKSSLGIGALLEDGIGDTIRVSLTEDPEFEAPVAKKILSRYINRINEDNIESVKVINYNPFNYFKRKTLETGIVGGTNLPRVIIDFSKREKVDFKDLKDIGYIYDAVTDKWNIADGAADMIYCGSNKLNIEIPSTLKILYDFNFWSIAKDDCSNPLLTKTEFLNTEIIDKENYVLLNLSNIDEDIFNKLKQSKKSIIVLTSDNKNSLLEQRRFFIKLLDENIPNPVIIKRDYKNISKEEYIIFSSTDAGALLIEGFGDGIWLSLESSDLIKNGVRISESIYSFTNRIMFGILQAARVRISKTEYIACPSCGRTLFDLQETTDKIKTQTEHLKGVKIAIMGCIVNGPGEMADADYGYVGSGVDKITLYKGKDVVKRNIDSSNAVEQLINIIKDDGRWIEPNN